MLFKGLPWHPEGLGCWWDSSRGPLAALAQCPWLCPLAGFLTPAALGKLEVPRSTGCLSHPCSSAAWGGGVFPRWELAPSGPRGPPKGSPTQLPLVPLQLGPPGEGSRALGETRPLWLQRPEYRALPPPIDFAGSFSPELGLGRGPGHIPKSCWYRFCSPPPPTLAALRHGEGDVMPFGREGRPACLESGYQMCPHTQGLGSGLASRASWPLHSQPRVPAPADEALGLGNWRAVGVAHLLILHCIRRGEPKGLRRWVSSGEETGFSTGPSRITGDAAGGTPFVQEGRASPDRRRAGVPGGFLEETSCDLSLADWGG